MSITRARLTHAIEAYTTIRSTTHAAALHAVIEQLFAELARLQMALADPDAVDDQAAPVIGTIVEQRPADQDTLKALRALTIAYRRLGGREASWHPELIEAERLLVSAGPRLDVPTVVRCEDCTSLCETGQCARQSIESGVQP